MAGGYIFDPEAAESRGWRWRRAHDVAALALRGRTACLNFADSPRRLRVPPIGASHDDIRRAAAEAAEAFQPPPDESNAATEVAAAALGATNSNAEQFASHPYYEVMDDGLDLGMQGYLDMAQGMLTDPPPMAGDPAVGGGEDDNDVEVQLWSY
uniref:AP2/ERF domain-containing protein n=1 Tax=Oryza glumipatula TaxID=40148 RepID=A0A0E0B8G2_9ORYZ